MEKKSSELFKLEGTPPLNLAFPLAFQHVVAMIVGCVTPALILANVAHLSPAAKIYLVQSSLVIAGLSTLLQLIRPAKFLGSGLPVILGVSFAYLPSMQAIAEGYDLATIFGAQLVGSFIAVLAGIFIKQLRRFFPPLITGTVVFTIGLSLYPTAINYMAGGVGSPLYGSWKNWVISILTLTVVTVFTHFATGLLKLASILIGIITGYLAAIPFGLVNLSAVSHAAVFQLPRLFYFGIKFEISSCTALGLLFAINSIQLIGDFTATTIGGLDREPTTDELHGGIIGYGISNMVGCLIGGLPTATYSQNVGIVTSTKVVNRKTMGLAAVIILLAGTIPRFSALLTTIPQSVLGGATISVFASIAMTGMKLVTSEPMSFRNSSIVGLAAALGIGISQAANALSSFPAWVLIIFGKSPVVVATLVAVLLNIILPRPEQKK
jgi:NCS2 family nucleobase:cation symporter-2